MSWLQSTWVTQTCFLINSVAILAPLGFLMQNFMKKVTLHCSCRDLKMVVLALLTLPAEFHDPE